MKIKVLLKVLERDEHGRPSTCQVVYDDSVAVLRNGDAIVSALVDAPEAEDSLRTARADIKARLAHHVVRHRISEGAYVNMAAKPGEQT